MAKVEHTRTQRVQIRIAPEAKRLIERAAALQNTSVSGFVVNSALDAASHWSASTIFSVDDNWKFRFRARSAGSRS